MRDDGRVRVEIGFDGDEALLYAAFAVFIVETARLAGERGIGFMLNIVVDEFHEPDSFWISPKLPIKVLDDLPVDVAPRLTVAETERVLAWFDIEQETGYLLLTLNEDTPVSDSGEVPEFFTFGVK